MEKRASGEETETFIFSLFVLFSHFRACARNRFFSFQRLESWAFAGIREHTMWVGRWNMYVIRSIRTTRVEETICGLILLIKRRHCTIGSLYYPVSYILSWCVATIYIYICSSNLIYYSKELYNLFWYLRDVLYDILG